jgi:hypothetical protein
MSELRGGEWRGHWSSVGEGLHNDAIRDTAKSMATSGLGAEGAVLTFAMATCHRERHDSGGKATRPFIGRREQRPIRRTAWTFPSVATRPLHCLTGTHPLPRHAALLEATDEV